MLVSLSITRGMSCQHSLEDEAKGVQDELCQLGLQL